MPRPTKGARLGSGPAHQKLMLGGLAAQLFVHEGIKTTEAKAKAVRPLAEKLITFAKKGDVAARREVLEGHPGPRRRAQAVRGDRAAVRGAERRLHADLEARAAAGRWGADGADRAGRGGVILDRVRGLPSFRDDGCSAHAWLMTGLGFGGGLGSGTRGPCRACWRACSATGLGCALLGCRLRGGLMRACMRRGQVVSFSRARADVDVPAASAGGELDAGA